MQGNGRQLETLTPLFSKENDSGCQDVLGVGHPYPHGFGPSSAFEDVSSANFPIIAWEVFCGQYLACRVFENEIMRLTPNEYQLNNTEYVVRSVQDICQTKAKWACLHFRFASSCIVIGPVGHNGNFCTAKQLKMPGRGDMRYTNTPVTNM